MLLHRDGAGTLSSDDRTRTLHDVGSPSGLDVDDHGHLFVSSAGKLVELDTDGHRVADSLYAGLPAGRIVHISRSFSNAPSRRLDFLSARLRRALAQRFNQP